MGIKIAIETRIEGTIEPAELGRYLIAYVAGELGIEDDAGLDWVTDSDGKTYIGGSEWYVSRDPKYSALVNAANYLIYDSTIQTEEASRADV